MATKTFKIGEYAVGGIIRATTEKETLLIQAMDYNTNEVLSKKDFNVNTHNVRYSVDEYLNELTSHYHASKVMEWIESKTKLNRGW